MKKQHYSRLILALILILALPAVSLAQTDDNSNLPPPPGPDGMPPPSAGILQRIRAAASNAGDQYYQNKLDNIRSNQDTRNAMLEDHPGFASSTRPFPGPAGRPMLASTTRPFMGSSTRPMFYEDRGDGRPDIDGSSTPPWFASSTMMEQMRNRADMRMDVFRMQQARIADELRIALNNLVQIRTRIGSRITKAEQAGTDVSDTAALLATADSKISLAEQAVAAIAAYAPASSTPDLTASSTVDLGKPRQIGDAAIRAIKDAQKALNDAVMALAHDLGLKLDDRSTSTPPMASTTSTQ